MKKILAILGLAIIVFSTTVDASEQQAVKTDKGFTYYIKDFPVGAKGVLIFEKTQILSEYNIGVEKPRFGVSKETIDENIDALNKYLKWATHAKERGDTLNKEIGFVRGFDLGLYNSVNFYEFRTSIDEFKNVNYLLSITPGTKLFGLQFKPTAVDGSNDKGDLVTSSIYNETEVGRIIARLLELKENKIINIKESDYK